MNPPDFCIDYEYRGKVIENCWKVQYTPPPELSEYRHRSKQDFDDFLRKSFTRSLSFRFGCLLLSDTYIKRIIKNQLKLCRIPEWVQEIEFQIQKGENHPQKNVQD